MPDFWLHATLNVGDAVGFGGQLDPARVKRRQALDRLLASAPRNYFASTMVFTNMAKNSPGRLAVIEKTLAMSPLHMSTRVHAIQHVRAQGVSGAKKATLFLSEGVDAFEVQLRAFGLSLAPVSHCIALLAWKAAALIRDGTASLSGATEELIDVARQAALRALELDPSEKMAKSLISLLKPPEDVVSVDASGTTSQGQDIAQPVLGSEPSFSRMGHSAMSQGWLYPHRAVGEPCSSAFAEAALANARDESETEARIAAVRDGNEVFIDRVVTKAALLDDTALWEGMYKKGMHTIWATTAAPKADLAQLFATAACLPTRPYGGLVSVVLGCGHGVEVDFLANVALGGDNIAAGVDLAPSAIKEAQNKFTSLRTRFYQANVCELPVPELPIDLIVDNTVWQNLREQPDKLQCYQEALRRISIPGVTMLFLTMMSSEGVAARTDLARCVKGTHLPLTTRGELLEAFDVDWAFEYVREGLYELDSSAAGIDCPAIRESGGIPSWTALAVRRRARPTHAQNDLAAEHKRYMDTYQLLVGAGKVQEAVYPLANAVRVLLLHHSVGALSEARALGELAVARGVLNAPLQEAS